MSKIVYGDLGTQGIEVIMREGRYFVRYDAGAHQVAWREDEVSPSEFQQLAAGGKSEQEAMLQLQRRLEQAGVNPYIQNWSPSQ